MDRVPRNPKGTNSMKTYYIDVHFDCAGCFPVNANSPEEAEAAIQRLVDSGELTFQSPRVEDTGDVEITAAGESKRELPKDSAAGLLPPDERNDDEILWY